MQKQGAMMVVCTRINPGKEAAYHKWYDEHANIMFSYPGMERVSRNRRIRPLGDNGGNSPEYITLYELKEKADLENYFKSSQMERAKKQFEEDWEGLGDVLWSGFYEALNVLKRGPLKGNKRYLEMVGSGPKEGREAAYLDYYVGHFTNMFEYEGIREISYVRMFMPMARDGKSHDYVTVYDFESEAAMNAFYQSPVFTGAKDDWEKKGQPVMDLQWAACYESVISLER
jgi:antibiotic biosynthesis monooxygenase (ABM) superfamily enzyme